LVVRNDFVYLASPFASSLLWRPRARHVHEAIAIFKSNIEALPNARLAQSRGSRALPPPSGGTAMPIVYSTDLKILSGFMHGDATGSFFINPLQYDLSREAE
jgi:hypothetical protein